MFQVAAWWSQFATLKRGQNVKHLPHAVSENGAISRGTGRRDDERNRNGNGRSKFHQENADAIKEELGWPVGLISAYTRFGRKFLLSTGPVSASLQVEALLGRNVWHCLFYFSASASRS